VVRVLENSYLAAINVIIMLKIIPLSDGMIELGVM
jgi:hypothetical protein